MRLSECAGELSLSGAGTWAVLHCGLCPGSKGGFHSVHRQPELLRESRGDRLPHNTNRDSNFRLKFKLCALW